MTVQQPAVKPGGKYFFSRNHSSLIAFSVGADYTPGSGFKMVGAHTDSPALKLKPISKKEAHGFSMIGAETYGGGLWHTWFDRELSVAGSVVVRKQAERQVGDKDRQDVTFERQLVRVPRPLMRIPSLCIHLQSGDERAALKVNPEDHLSPILGMVEQEV
jgi:aspartyl aminopeptidase